MTPSALDIAQALIRCPSVTPVEAGALDCLERFLTPVGFRCTRLTFSDPNTPDVDNLFATIGSGAPHLVFAGHTDVVPTGDEAQWRHPPFAGEVAEGRLWGRGACDMKGGIAAFAAAALNLIAERGPPEGTLSFLITNDEEGPAINGTAKLLEWAQAQGIRFDACLVGEPTNPHAIGDMVKIGRRGSLNGDILVRGRQGHSAYPAQADNPIPVLARIVTALTEAPLDEGTEAFDPTRLVFTSIDVGNVARNVIPGEARAKFNVRFNDLWTPDTLEARLRAIVEQAGAGRAMLTVQPCNSLAFRTQRGAFTDLVVGAITDVTRRRPELSTTGGTSDARFISQYAPVLEFGLVGETIHATDENIRLDDLDLLTRCYRAILDRYFA